MIDKIDLTGVLLAGGRGLRAYPSTKFLPKPLFKVDGKTLLLKNIEILINEFKVKEIFIVVGHLSDSIINYINGLNLDTKITFISQKKINGIANALLLLKEKLNKKKFIVILADEYYHNPNHSKLLNKISNDFSCILTFINEPNKNIVSKNFIGNFEKDRIVSLKEKPLNPNTSLMGVGTYFFDESIFEYIEKTNFSKLRNEREITDVISNMAKNKKIGYQVIDCKYFNISNRSDLITANYYVRDNNFDNKKISLIIPAYNEENSIEEVIIDFKSYNIFDEIIIVDNNSTDNTKIKASSAGVKVISESKQGYGHSLMKGMKEASGDILFLTEADGSFKGRDVDKFLTYLKEADMVIGTRTTRQMIEQGSNMDWITRWANVMFAKFVELLWWNSDPGITPRFTDVGCTYRAIWKSSFDEIKDLLNSPGPEFSIEMMLALMCTRQRIIEVPISYFNRIGGESKHSSNYIAKARTAYKMMKVTIKVRLSNFKFRN